MLPQLIYLLGVLLLAVLALRAVRAGQARLAGPPPGAETGPLEAYFARIENLTESSGDSFFVTAREAGSSRLLQMASGPDRDGIRRFRFDLPITDWSRAYAVRIEAEARHRGLAPYRSGDAEMTFLDIDFADAPDHSEFARWVASDVFGLPPDARFEITWG